MYLTLSKLCKVALLILTVLVSQIANQDPSPPATQDVLINVYSRIDGLAVTVDGLQANLGPLDSRLSQLEKWEWEDFSSLRNTVSELTDRFNFVEAALVNATKAVTKMSTINNMWRKNFRVLNRTVEELRRKFKAPKPRAG